MEEQFGTPPEYYARFTDEHGEMWCCAGRLTDNQADIVREELVGEFGEENILLRSLDDLHAQWQQDKVRTIEKSPGYPKHTSEDEKQSYIIGILLYDDPAEKTEIRFKLSIEKQILTPAQQEALDKCAAIANRVMAADGQGKPQEAIELTDKPVRVIIEGVTPVAQKQLRQANYDAELALKYADKDDEWHHLSKAKYSGKGWAAIATAELEQELRGGKRDKITTTDIENRARTIQNRVEALRKKLGLEASEADE